MGGGEKGGLNELLDSMGGWVGGWVGGTYLKATPGKKLFTSLALY